MPTKVSDVDKSPIASPPAPTEGRGRKFLRRVPYILIAFIAVSQLSGFLWKRSGSNEWALKKEKDGIKIWTMKTPGASLVKVKAHMRMQSTLSPIVNFLEGTEVVNDNLGFQDLKVLEKREGPSGFDAYYSYKQNLPQPIGMREIVLLMHHVQDPRTKRIKIDVLAAPNKIPPNNEGIIRLTHLNNIWLLTPVSASEVDIELTVDVDLAGDLPFFMKNLILPEAFYETFDVMRVLLKKDKYKDGKAPFIKEYGENV